MAVLAVSPSCRNCVLHANSFVVIRAIIDCYDQHKLVMSLDATANFPPRHMVQLRQSSSAGADFGSIPGAQGALVPSLGDPKLPESC